MTRKTADGFNRCPELYQKLDGSLYQCLAYAGHDGLHAFNVRRDAPTVNEDERDN